MFRRCFPTCKGMPIAKGKFFLFSGLVRFMKRGAGMVEGASCMPWKELARHLQE